MAACRRAACLRLAIGVYAARMIATGVSNAEQLWPIAGAALRATRAHA
jgi:hypothetical protein